MSLEWETGLLNALSGIEETSVEEYLEPLKDWIQNFRDEEAFEGHVLKTFSDLRLFMTLLTDVWNDSDEAFRKTLLKCIILPTSKAMTKDTQTQAWKMITESASVDDSLKDQLKSILDGEVMMSNGVLIPRKVKEEDPESITPPSELADAVKQEAYIPRRVKQESSETDILFTQVPVKQEATIPRRVKVEPGVDAAPMEHSTARQVPSTSSTNRYGLSDSVIIPPSVTPDLLQGKLLQMTKELPPNLATDALQEFEDAVGVKGNNIRNRGAYLSGVLKRYMSVHERAVSGEGTRILPMGDHITPIVNQRLEELVTSGFCGRDEMNEKVKSKIRMLSEEHALQAIQELSSVDRTQIRNFGSYFMGILNRYMRGDAESKGQRGRDRNFRDSHQPSHRERSRDRHDDRNMHHGRPVPSYQHRPPPQPHGTPYPQPFPGSPGLLQYNGHPYQPVQPPPAFPPQPNPYMQQDPRNMTYHPGGQPTPSNIPPFQNPHSKVSNFSFPPQQQPQQQPLNPNPIGNLDILALADRAASAVQSLANSQNNQNSMPHHPMQHQQFPFPSSMPPTVGSFNLPPPSQHPASMPLPQSPRHQGNRNRTATAKLEQLPINVQFAVRNLVATGQTNGPLDEGIIGMIYDLQPEPLCLDTLTRFAEMDKSQMRNKTGYLAGVLKRELQKINMR